MRNVFALALAIGLASCSDVGNDPVKSATATNAGNGKFELAWTGSEAPVDVYVAKQPNAPRDQMQPLAVDDRDGKVVVETQPGIRPYFYVASEGGGVWTAERVLPLEGGSNFRDLGGYATEDGRTVRWGRLYRSGNMAGLTAADYEYLSGLGIKVVCDLRTNEERESMPNRWVTARNVDYWSRDYGMSNGELRRLLSEGTTREGVKQAMVAAYGNLPYEQAPGYREIFDRLAGGEIPLAFNCTGGKDRAGIGAALILTILGVPRETIVTDYALTDKVIDQAKARRSIPSAQTFDEWPPELLAPLSASDPDYLRAAFAAIEKRSGSIATFLREEVAVTDDEIKSIREALLE